MELHRVLERDREEERKATGIKKSSHCWAHAQGRCRKVDCTYLHPQDIGPYIPHTPCVNWSSCTGAPYCPFLHPDEAFFGGGSQRGTLIQGYYIGQLATIYGKPVTFNGTTFFPTLGAMNRGQATIQFGGEFGNGMKSIEALRNGHARHIHEPAVTKSA
ncbi:hypothetical protein AX14_005959 [Amanita brunnescens Koide BX004]|nr:hypothetical protein AX14_005959 [Amanita brunnescens Koide BX004]